MAIDSGQYSSWQIGGNEYLTFASIIPRIVVPVIFPMQGQKLPPHMTNVVDVSVCTVWFIPFEDKCTGVQLKQQ